MIFFFFFILWLFFFLFYVCSLVQSCFFFVYMQFNAMKIYVFRLYLESIFSSLILFCFSFRTVCSLHLVNCMWKNSPKYIKQNNLWCLYLLHRIANDWAGFHANREDQQKSFNILIWNSWVRVCVFSVGNCVFTMNYVHVHDIIVSRL